MRKLELKKKKKKVKGILARGQNCINKDAHDFHWLLEEKY